MTSSQADPHAASGPLVVVDDSAEELRLARACFERSSWSGEIVALGSGRDLLDHLDAVERGEAPMPAAVLLDANMPGMSGLETLRALRSRERFARLPVVVVFSASDNPDHAREAETLGADAYQTKPERLKDYVAFLDHVATIEPRASMA